MSDKENNDLLLDAGDKLYQYSRELRKRMTPAEKKLWRYLRNRKLDELKFRRQHPLSSFIADFYCHENKLVIECDGSVHDGKFNEAYDIMRTETLLDSGITVQRFRNDLIMNNIGLVLYEIRKTEKTL